MQDIAGLWAWPREIHADLIDALTEFKPRAVVFDIAFSERDLKRPKSDARLSESLKANPHAYLSAVRLRSSPGAEGVMLHELASVFGISSSGSQEANAVLQLPHAVDRTAWRLGLINSIEDNDGILRRYRL
jgi:adenylate cyclase